MKQLDIDERIDAGCKVSTDALYAVFNANMTRRRQAGLRRKQDLLEPALISPRGSLVEYDALATCAYI